MPISGLACAGPIVITAAEAAGLPGNRPTPPSSPPQPPRTRVRRADSPGLTLGSRSCGTWPPLPAPLSKQPTATATAAPPRRDRSRHQLVVARPAESGGSRTGRPRAAAADQAPTAGRFSKVCRRVPRSDCLFSSSAKSSSPSWTASGAPEWDKPAHWIRLDRRYESIRVKMHGLFSDVGICWCLNAPYTTSCRSRFLKALAPRVSSPDTCRATSEAAQFDALDPERHRRRRRQRPGSCHRLVRLEPRLPVEVGDTDRDDLAEPAFGPGLGGRAG